MTEKASYLTIDEVARDTGLGKDTLRVWERRYGFPDPQRSDLGERLYGAAHLARLRLICRLIDAGHRPGRVVPLSVADLNRLAQAWVPCAAESTCPDTAALIGLLESGQTQAFKARLGSLLEQQGAEAFVYRTAQPLLTLTGDAWAEGRIPIYLEHFVTQQLSAAIHVALAQLAVATTGLRVLLTTLPGEPHGMGLLLVELLLGLQGVETVNLGLETPVDQLQQACHALQPHAVALSFSTIQKRPKVMAALRELEEKMPERVAILAGGQGITRLRSLPGRISVIKQMERLGAAVDSLREAAIGDTAATSPESRGASPGSG